MFSNKDSKQTFGFGAFAAVFALKYLLIPLLILSCFSLSSSRFRLAVTRQILPAYYWTDSLQIPALPFAGRSSSPSLSVAA